MKNKILVIEDDIDLSEMVSARLTKEGYEVELAFDGEEGLAKVRSLDDRPDLILLDLKLPKIDGYQVCELLKTDEAYKNIPIIILSGRKDDIEKKAGFAVGADDYLVKPYQPEKLISIIKDLLNAPKK